MPIFLPNGNVNPAYLAAERADQAKTKTKNIRAVEAKRKKLVGKKQFELADYVRKKIGSVGSGKDYYQSGR
jgi:cysteinyl-tRNA synthetase